MNKKRFTCLLVALIMLLGLIGVSVWAADAALRITQQPVGVTVGEGQRAAVTVGAKGHGLTYRWYYRNAGSARFVYTDSFHTNTYALPMTAARDGRQVYCVITDTYGNSVQTNTVTLHMGQPLTADMLPDTVEALPGEKAVVTVSAQGDDLTYHWYYKDAGSDTFRRTATFKGSSYTVVMNEARDGRQVYCVIGDSHGNAVQTNTVTLSMAAEIPVEPSLPDDGIYDIGYDPLPYSDGELYQQLFDLNNKVEVDIDMPDSELQKLQDDYDRYRNMGSKSPIYRMGTLTIRITTAEGTTTYRMEEVGVRMKGNTSRTSFYSKDGGIYNHIHFKLDFQETFDDEDYYGADAKVWSDKDQRKVRKDRTFAAMEKLELRWNKCGDSTYLKETYAYSLYRSEDVIAPLVSLCSLDWSGLHMGIYTINEPVDELFLEKRLPEAELGGDLYKCSMTDFTNTNSIGIEDEDKAQFFDYDLKANKKTSDHSTLKNFINTLNSGNMTKEKFAEMVDVDQFLHYAAVSYFLGNPDDLRNNYNNCYIYFTKESNKLIVIPYDTDRCLGIVHEWNPTGNGLTKDDPFTENALGNGGSQRNPLYRLSVLKGGWYHDAFAQVLEEVAENELLNADTFESLFRSVTAIYGSYAIPTRAMNNAGGRAYAFDLDSSFGGNLSFRSYITAKMETFRSYMDSRGNTSGIFYVRGSFNDWSVQDSYRMSKSGTRLTFTLSFSHDFEFKLYDDTNGSWYGVEIVSEDTTVPYEGSSSHGNVHLQRGSYRLTYDPAANTLTITYA